MRASWVASRTGQANVSQMHYARQGLVTEEMVFVARRENLPESLVMEEVARGRMVIPANINHTNLEPMAIGIASKCKVNANIGASPNASDMEEEVNKLFPYNRADSTMRTVYSLFFNALALGMIVMLLLWLIGAGVIAELGGAR